MMHTSAKGLEFIKGHEGLRLTAYPDPVGVWTIGYGHTGEEYAREGVKISKGKAEALFRQDIHEAETILLGAINREPTQGEFDALVSFVFNVGPGSAVKDGFVRLKNGKPSTLRALYNKGDIEGASLQFGRWVYGTKNGKKIRLPGLIKRRAEEAALFLADAERAEAGVIGEAQDKPKSAPAAAAFGGVAAVAAPILQAASGSNAATVATVAAALAAAYLIYKLTQD